MISKMLELYMISLVALGGFLCGGGAKSERTNLLRLPLVRYYNERDRAT